MTIEHNHSAASNTEQVWQTFVGCTLKGHIRDEETRNNVTDILVFHCGWGLAIYQKADSLACWVEQPREIGVIIKRWRNALAIAEAETKMLLELAGWPAIEDSNETQP